MTLWVDKTVQEELGFYGKVHGFSHTPVVMRWGVYKKEYVRKFATWLYKGAPVFLKRKRDTLIALNILP